LIYSVILECDDDEGVHISLVFLIDLGLCNYSVALLKPIYVRILQTVRPNISQTNHVTSQSANPYLAVIGPTCFVYRIYIVLPIGIQLGRHLVGYNRSVHYQTVIIF
jgi:hypothetical protein